MIWRASNHQQSECRWVGRSVFTGKNHRKKNTLTTTTTTTLQGSLVLMEGPHSQSVFYVPVFRSLP